MPKLDRRHFLAGAGAAAAATCLGKVLRPAEMAKAQSGGYDVYIAKNGTPVTNVQMAVQLAGGIQRFIGIDDVVILKPNGQWPLQGYTHTQCLKALIDVILARPGGFTGEVIIAEHVHRSYPDAETNTSYCWSMSSGYNRTNNWADRNYLELVADYHTRGILNVSAVPLYDSGTGPFVAVSDPASLPAGKHGWIRTTYTLTSPAGRTVNLSRMVLRSPYSGSIVDSRFGVWASGGYTGQAAKMIFLPTLNNHGSYNSEDYAGPTSAVKCHVGVVDFLGSASTNLHSVGYNDSYPEAVGEAVGQLITQVIQPSFYLTCAEYTGYRSRTHATAAWTKTVGLCTDPVTLDYWMCKYVMLPCATSQTFMNPDNNNNLRKQLLGCHGKGVGTLTESEISLHLFDYDLTQKTYLPLIMKS